MSIVFQKRDISHIEMIAKIFKLWNIRTYKTNHYFTGSVLLSVWIRTAYNYIITMIIMKFLSNYLVTSRFMIQINVQLSTQTQSHTIALGDHSFRRMVMFITLISKAHLWVPLVAAQWNEHVAEKERERERERAREISSTPTWLPSSFLSLRHCVLTIRQCGGKVFGSVLRLNIAPLPRKL